MNLRAQRKASAREALKASLNLSKTLFRDSSSGGGTQQTSKGGGKPSAARTVVAWEDEEGAFSHENPLHTVAAASAAAAAAAATTTTTTTDRNTPGAFSSFNSLNNPLRGRGGAPLSLRHPSQNSRHTRFRSQKSDVLQNEEPSTAVSMPLPSVVVERGGENEINTPQSSSFTVSTAAAAAAAAEGSLHSLPSSTKVSMNPLLSLRGVTVVEDSEVGTSLQERDFVASESEMETAEENMKKEEEEEEVELDQMYHFTNNPLHGVVLRDPKPAPPTSIQPSPHRSPSRLSPPHVRAWSPLSSSTPDTFPGAVEETGGNMFSVVNPLAMRRFKSSPPQ